MIDGNGGLIIETPVSKLRPISSVFRFLMIILVAGFFLVMSVELFAFAEPYLFPLHMLRGQAAFVGDNIIIGPYPHRDELRRLKNNLGVVEVISVLDPKLTVENRLLKRERAEARALGLKFTSRPMSWISLNSAGNKRVAEEIGRYAALKFGRSSTKKIYINCYLGRHRIRLVKAAIKRFLEKR